MIQIKLGNRCVDVNELLRLSMDLGSSLDDSMSKDFSFSPDVKSVPIQLYLIPNTPDPARLQRVGELSLVCND